LIIRVGNNGFGVSAFRAAAPDIDIIAVIDLTATDRLAQLLKYDSILGRLTDAPDRPRVVALGGSKGSDTLAVIDNLVARANTLLNRGGTAYTFPAAQGFSSLGTSLLERDQIQTRRGLAGSRRP